MSSADETIRAESLRKVPHLKSCPYWDRATFLGWVCHRLQFAYYDGGLVRYNDRVYYVNRTQIESLRPWLHWNLRKTISVIGT